MKYQYLKLVPSNANIWWSHKWKYNKYSNQTVNWLMYKLMPVYLYGFVYASLEIDYIYIIATKCKEAANLCIVSIYILYWTMCVHLFISRYVYKPLM